MYIQRFKPNLLGRDFVCGDIHGSLSCLMKFLEEINFNFETDRFFCCGDLIDRGPSNEECLELLFEPWFFMVRGNHEELMSDYFSNSYMGIWWPRNGGNWGTHYKRENSDLALFVKDAVEKINSLPHLITVEKRDGGIFHIIHAELHSDTPLTDDILASEEELRKYADVQTPDGNFINWGRKIFYYLYNKHLDEHCINKFIRYAELEKIDALFGPELSHIYSGHTNIRHAITFKGQTNLDTQAYKSYDANPEVYCGLTVTEPSTGLFWFANDREFKEIKPIVIE